MILETREHVDAPLDQAWDRIVDPSVWRACTPGLAAFMPGHGGDFGMTVAVGSAGAPAEVRFERLEASPPERLRLRMVAKHDRGSADAELVVTLGEVDEGTQFHVRCDLQLGGELLQRDSHELASDARELVARFFTRLDAASLCAGAAPAPPEREPESAERRGWWARWRGKRRG